MSETKPGKKRICFIINPISGRRQIKNIEGLIGHVFDSENYFISIKYTKKEGHAKQLCNEALIKKADIIVAVGGDGTMNEVASEMLHSKAVLGIIPCGSGNGLARHLSIPFNKKKALKLIKEGHYTDIDTATVNNKKFISLAGVGFDAVVAKKFAKSKRRGFFTYLTIIAKNYFRFKQQQYRIEFKDGKTLNRKALFISFANSNQFGYNTQIAPNAMLNDGKLDICIVKKPRLKELPNIANLLLLKKIDQSGFADVIKSSEIFIEREFDEEVNIDGEAVSISKNISVKVDPLSLKIIIPKNGKKKQ